VEASTADKAVATVVLDLRDSLRAIQVSRTGQPAVHFLNLLCG